MQRNNAWIWALVLCLTLGGTAFGQGLQTGTLVGSVTSNDGAALPGVTVTVTSTALQGERSTVSAVNGDYVLRGLPPGQYRVLFTLEGMKSVERQIQIGLGTTARADAVMEVAAAEETIVVTGEAPSALETTTIGANFSSSTVDALPLQLTAGSPLQAIADLAGGLTDNGTVAGQVTIGGAFAYDNVFLVNGVDINDRYFGTANNLFIEDAIEETQVLTSGISAEYGRFSGGVINAITKSGGNQFTGSFRADLSRPEWRDETQFERDRGTTREGDLSKIYTATLGGPILRDRLWFFLAGRDTEASVAFTLPASGIADTNVQGNERQEVNLTFAATPNHSLKGSYINNDTTNTLERQVTPLTMQGISQNSVRENTGWTLSYNGVFSNSLFGELRYSEKHFGFRGLGGTDTAKNRSPLRSRGRLPGTVVGVYNAPYFDATDPEDRDNEQIYGALSYFWSSESLGSHDIKVGYEGFSDIGVGGNSQTATGYIYRVDYLVENGRPVLDAQGDLIPVWNPGAVRVLNWIPTRGAQNTLETNSFFINDRWNLNKNFSFNIGVRYEDIVSKSAAGIPEIGSDSIVPRLGASYDVRGDGKYKFDVTYSQYSGKASANQLGAVSPSGNPSLAYGTYLGPAGVGDNFAPAFDDSNYLFFYFYDPLQTLRVPGDLKTPKTEEIGAAFGMDFGRGSYMKLSYSRREVSDFIEGFIDTTTGVADVTFPGFEGSTPAEISELRNSSVPQRKYEHLLLDFRYRILDNWTLSGNWTWQLKNEGDFEGEAGQSPGIDSLYGNYPELFFRERNYPYGNTDDYQEHKIRLWTNYALDLGRAGAIDFGLIGRYDSQTTFSYFVDFFPLSDFQWSRDPGYVGISGDQTLFFGKRGAGEFNSFWSADLSLVYSIPVWKSVEPWVKFTVTNVTNEDQLVTFNTQVFANTAGPVDQYGLPTTFTRGPNFGRATSSASYQTPREYFVSAGIRF